jgi:hypothetical protein
MVRVLPNHFGVVLIRLQRRRGEEKNFLGSEKFFQGLGARNRAAQANQAKGSLRGQVTYSESGWCLAEAVDICLGDYVTVCIFLGLHHVWLRHGSSAVHNLSFGKWLLITNVWHIATP